MIIESTFPFDYLTYCKTCNITNRFNVTYKNMLPVSSTCCDRILLTQTYDWLSNLIGRKIYIHYYNGNTSYVTFLVYSFTIDNVIANNTIVVGNDIINHKLINGYIDTSVDPWCETYETEFNGEITGTHYTGIDNGIYLNFGKYSLTQHTITFVVDYIQIVWWGNANQTSYPDGVLIPFGQSRITLYLVNTSTALDNYYENNITNKTYTRRLSVSNIVINGSCNIILAITLDTRIWSLGLKIEYGIRITNLVNCRGEEVPRSGAYICIPDAQDGGNSNYFTVQPTETYGAPNENTNIDDLITYSIICKNKTIDINYNDLNQETTSFYFKTEYKDDVDVYNQLLIGNNTFPFDYKINCTDK